MTLVLSIVLHLSHGMFLRATPSLTTLTTFLQIYSIVSMSVLIPQTWSDSTKYSDTLAINTAQDYIVSLYISI